MHDATQPDAGFHGIFEKLRQLDVAHRVVDDIYADSDANFWNDYCGDDVSDLIHFKRQLSSPGLRVLDLACGAGRIAIAMAREGAVVDGLELSPAMLELASDALAAEPPEVAQRLRFVQGDMADFHLDQRYDRILLGATSICLLLQAPQRAGLFACVRTHLAEGGRFVFNLLDNEAADGTSHDEFMDVFTRSTPDGQDFAIVGQRIDPATGHVRFNVYRERIAWNGDTVRTLGASVKARIRRGELLELMQQHGLRVESEFREAGVTYWCAVALAAGSEH